MRFLILIITGLAIAGCTPAIKHSWNKTFAQAKAYDSSNLGRFFGKKELDDGRVDFSIDPSNWAEGWEPRPASEYINKSSTYR